MEEEENQKFNFSDFGAGANTPIHRKDTSLGDSTPSMSSISQELEPKSSTHDESCPSTLPMKKSIRKLKTLKRGITTNKDSAKARNLVKKRKKFLKPRTKAEIIILKNSKKFIETTKNKDINWEQVNQNKKVKERIFRARLDNAFDIEKVEVLPLESLSTKVDQARLNETACFSTFPANFSSILDLPNRADLGAKGRTRPRNVGGSHFGFGSVLEQLRRSRDVNFRGSSAVTKVLFSSKMIFRG